MQLSDYNIIRELGSGTYSTVFLAVDKNTQVGYAFKQMKQFKDVDGFPNTTAREIRILQHLQHPNIVKLVRIITHPGFIDGSGSVYLVFEYLPHDLQSLLHARTTCNQLDVPQIKGYLYQLVNGIKYIHQMGFVHRDIKPSNLLIGNDGFLRIADFGLARKISKHDCHSNVITLIYRPPELILGKTKYAGEIDMWSVGCIFFECYSKRPLFIGSSEGEVLYEIYRIIGTPDPKIVENYKYWKTYQPKQEHSNHLRDVLKNFPSDFVNAVCKILCFDPKERITAEKLLEEEYFKVEPFPLLPWQMKQFDSTLHANFNYSPITPTMSPYTVSFE
ncbi:cyclin-dependent kinase [Entamoeba marina]